MDKWSNDKIYKLIEKYRELTCLWDCSDPNYRNKVARNQALQTLIEHMNLRGWNCAKMYTKIHSIRKSYMCEKRRVLKSKRLSSNKEDQHVPTLFYYKKVDAFLDKVIKYRNFENRSLKEQLDKSLEQDETRNIFQNQQQDELNETTDAISIRESDDGSRSIFSSLTLTNFGEQNIKREEESTDSVRKNSLVKHLKKKKRVSKKKEWDSVKICKLLDKYREYPCLWNRTDSNYRNQNDRSYALLNLIKHMNLPNWSLEQMEKKIKAIRGTYMNEKRRVLKNKELGVNYVPKLVYYKMADDFLDEEIIFRNYENSLAKQFGESFENDEAVHMFQKHGESNKEYIEANLSNDEELNDEESNDEKSNCEESNDDDKSIIMKSEADPLTLNSKIAPKKFLLFGKYVAQQLNELPLMNAYKLEAEIQQLISNAKIKALSEVEDNNLK